VILTSSDFTTDLRHCNYETENITRNGSDAAENLQLLCRFVWFFQPRSLRTTTHLTLFSECSPIYASCVKISGGRTKQLHIIAGFAELAAIDYNTSTFPQYINRIINI